MFLIIMRKLLFKSNAIWSFWKIFVSILYAPIFKRIHTQYIWRTLIKYKIIYKLNVNEEYKELKK